MTLIKGLLARLRDCLEECLASEEEGPLYEAKQCVDAIISNLASVAVAVRQTGRRSRLIKADRRFDPVSLDDGGLREHLQHMILIRQRQSDPNSAERENHTEWWESEIKKTLTPLQKRLVDANLKRRHRFQYAQRHSMKLSSRQRPEPSLPSKARASRQLERPKAQGPEERPEERDDTETITTKTATHKHEFVTRPPTLSGTSASIPESNFKWPETQAETPAPKSQITSITGATDYPKLSHSKQKITKCPCCCEVLPNSTLEVRGGFKQHLSADIYPYTCIAEHCPTPYVLYRTRAEWEDHIKAHHSKKWNCQLCDTSADGIFSSIDLLQRHVAEKHLESFPEELLDTVALWPSIPSIDLKECPLCYSKGREDDQEFIEHVLTHTHDFSLLSLPWADSPLKYPSQDMGQRYNLNYIASSEPQDKDASLLPWLMHLWLQELEIEESAEWERSVTRLSELEGTRTRPDLPQSPGYFATNVYFDLEASDESLGVEARSKVSASSSDKGDGYTYEGDGLLSLADDDDETDLRVLLDRYRIEGCNGPFWTEKLLRRILTKQRVELALRTHGFNSSDTQYYLNKILVPPTHGRVEEYLRIFALLLMTFRVPDISKFLTEKVHDEELPVQVDLDSPHAPVSPRSRVQESLRCFQGWNWDQKESFAKQQWRLIFPFLSVSELWMNEPVILGPHTVRPWQDDNTRSNMGMFETVSAVKIHPTAHCFDNFLSERNLKCSSFALKTIRDERLDSSEFMRDLKELKQEFGERLVPILGSFWHEGESNWSLILPLARCTLRDLIEHGKADWTPKRLEWGYRQLYGITHGITAIHSYSAGVRPDFTIHGHINLETILCYGELELPEQCVLVVSHFPLSAFRPGSDSETASDDEATVDTPTFWSPTYRPPEWDIHGGHVSKSSDIWSLGCVFLEFVTWLLGGWDQVLRFKDLRLTPHVDGALTDRFYTIMLSKSQMHYVVSVKMQVTEASMASICRHVRMLIKPVDSGVATPCQLLKSHSRSSRHGRGLYARGAISSKMPTIIERSPSTVQS
ncbi:hypothetical protein CDV31_007639 [Fusarium ambrosium]|uniref:Protein kinase domain-containing protein n=1 Tax=Fusarium ambrosium TaxID=131363 RepID=A0A428U5C8_9HYPO|nr:hypothetical protein CDV31_007639 [Fusarium ambrosium]